jgi:hypothetical protein
MIFFYFRVRTKATASQQKEANIINTSLMQLWRCLQAVKKRVRIDNCFFVLLENLLNFSCFSL